MCLCHKRISQLQLGVIKELSNVKRLKISGDTFEELLFPDDLFTSWPMFHKLVRLEVTSKISFSKDKTLLNFLRISPNLETIVFAKGFVAHQSSTDSGWTAAVVPQCMLLRLKSVKFCKFYGHLEEVNAVKTFLKNAGVLQRMIIRFRHSLSTDEQNKVMKKLLKFPRSSAGCIIEI
ncbi:FBD-associated F-box protein At5g22730-like [Papaver somniferum]|uniref:FBD-associated F-box protein At5g22730-like n=1 Tax=Papaver somniferum TaxID=3469 RepID=UPI000E70580D|nr:FBD-associated F-box protein At5g22730-like [Papaver somniferum]